jgi:uncharacterized membrane protein HdeD (DUF308 family)
MRWLPIVHGAFTIVVGLLLLVVPGRTLTFVAVLAGIWLCVVAVIEFIRAFAHGISGALRVAEFGVALLALVTGILVIARPEGTIRAIAVIAGIYLVIVGAAALLLGAPGVPRAMSLLRGVLSLAVGVALLVWPDVTVGVVAALYGALLIILGAAEVFFGLKLRHVDDAA